MIVYKVRNKDTGLFSHGKMNDQWNKVGKIWTDVAALKGYLRFIQRQETNRIAAITSRWPKGSEGRQAPLPANIEVVALMLEETPVGQMSASEFLLGVAP